MLWGLGFRVWVVWGLGFRVQGFRGLGFRVLGWVLPTHTPVTVYIRGLIKGYISPHENYYPTVTEGGQHPRFGPSLDPNSI